MLNKTKILQMLDSKIEFVTQENRYDNNLSDDCFGKHQFIAASSRALRELKEIRAFINSGLAEE